MILRLFLLIMLTFSNILAHAEIYKWRDPQGNLHYTQTPPPGGKAEIIKPIKAPSNAGRVSSSPQERLKLIEEQNKSAVEASSRKQQSKQEIKRKQEYCKQTKINLEVLQNHGRVRIKEGDQYRVLPEEERQDKIDELIQQIEEFCT